jgi:hypothetical protein
MEPDVLARVALLFDDEEFCYRDVVAAAVINGSWAEFAARAARHTRPAPDHLEPSQVKEQIERFRRSRHLEAASDLHKWLDLRDLSNDQLSNFARWLAHEERTDRTFDGKEEPLGSCAWWSEAALAGDFGSWAEVLVGWLGAERLLAKTGVDQTAGDLGDIELELAMPAFVSIDRDRLRRIAEAKRAHDDCFRASANEDAMRTCLARNGLLWTELEYSQAEFGSVQAAREALLCVREDRESLKSVAERAGTEVRTTRALYRDLPPSLGAVVVALIPGDCAIHHESAIVLHRRVSPTLEQPRTRRMAAEELAREAIEASVAGRVREVGSW